MSSSSHASHQSVAAGRASLAQGQGMSIAGIFIQLPTLLIVYGLIVACWHTKRAVSMFEVQTARAVQRALRSACGHMRCENGRAVLYNTTNPDTKLVSMHIRVLCWCVIWQKSVLAALRDRHIRYIHRANILRFGPDQAVIAILLVDVRRPARHSADRKDRREKIDRNAERVIDRC